MRKLIVFAAAIIASLLLATPAHAGNPHFVGTPSVTRVSDVLSVSFKLAGLGNEDQVTVILTADAQCWNRGGNAPQAENKGATLGAVTVPVQNGKAEGTVTGSAQTDPSCVPPMELRYTAVTITGGGTSYTAPGTF